MGKLLFRLIFRLAKKFALKGLEAFLAKYAEDQFSNLLEIPKFPDIDDFPDIEIPQTGDGEQTAVSINTDAARSVIKDNIAKIGGATILLLGAAENISNSETKSASVDLDRAKSDWNDDIIPVTAAFGIGINRIVDKNVTDDENKITPPSVDFGNMPHFKFKPLPEYIPVSRRGEKTETPSGGGTATGGSQPTMSGGKSQPRPSGGIFDKTKRKKVVKTRNKFEIITRSGGETRIRYRGAEWTVDKYKHGEQMSGLLKNYTYDSATQSIGATGAFFGGESGRMRPIKEIILHCTGDPKGVDHTLEYYNTLHSNRDDGTWKGIGYHFIIHPNGTIESARPANMIGAHVKSPNNYHNKVSIGIAYIGGAIGKDLKWCDTRTVEQKIQIWNLVLRLLDYFPSATVHGHYEFSTKQCPCFNVEKEFAAIKNNTYDLGGGNIVNLVKTDSSFQYVDNTKKQKIERTGAKSNDV